MKNTINWAAYDQETFAQFRRLGSPRSWHEQIQYLVKICVLEVLFAITSCGRGGKRLSRASFMRALIPSWELCHHDLITSHRPPPLNIITLRVQILMWVSGNGNNQTKALILIGKTFEAVQSAKYWAKCFSLII